MAFICGSAVTFSSLAYVCPFRPTQHVTHTVTFSTGCIIVRRLLSSSPFSLSGIPLCIVSQ